MASGCSPRARYRGSDEPSGSPTSSARRRSPSRATPAGSTSTRAAAAATPTAEATAPARATSWQRRSRDGARPAAPGIVVTPPAAAGASAPRRVRRAGRWAPAAPAPRPPRRRRRPPPGRRPAASPVPGRGTARPAGPAPAACRAPPGERRALPAGSGGRTGEREPRQRTEGVHVRRGRQAGSGATAGSAYPGVAWVAGSTPSSPAVPRSASTGRPSARNSTLPRTTSPCTTPRSCRSARAPATAVRTVTTSAGSRPPRARTRRRQAPAGGELGDQRGPAVARAGGAQQASAGAGGRGGAGGRTRGGTARPRPCPSGP